MLDIGWPNPYNFNQIVALRSAVSRGTVSSKLHQILANNQRKGKKQTKNRCLYPEPKKFVSADKARRNHHFEKNVFLIRTAYLFARRCVRIGGGLYL